MNLLGPPDWAKAYDVDRLYSPGIGGKSLDGTGVTIGIVGTAAIAQFDIDAFNTSFGLPKRTVTMTLVPDTGPSGKGMIGAGMEAILDTEWSGGIAKGATVNYVYIGQDDEGNVDDATTYLIEENIAPVMSESYGGCEAGITLSDADIANENGTAANLMGITYMASAGDSGAADCAGYLVYGMGLPGLYVDMPGSLPAVTSVGGTQFPSPSWTDAGALVDAGLEQVWNEGNDPYYIEGNRACAEAAGSARSSCRPAYQTVDACSRSGRSRRRRQGRCVRCRTSRAPPPRDSRDTSSSAPCTAACTASRTAPPTGGSPVGQSIGGTSASSPSFAGLVAILNQAVGERLGNINPILYQLAKTSPAASPSTTSCRGTTRSRAARRGR